jgi:N-acetylglucosamine-6-sulfatase
VADARGRTRRTPLIVATLVALIAVSAVGTSVLLARGGGSSRPNIVVILTDDQRWDQLDTMPNVESLLVHRGMTFSNAFVTTSLCCPSRASILTGQYSHHTGVFDGSASGLPGGAPAFHDGSTVATWLDDAGYTTGLVGKYLNDLSGLPVGYVPPGWDRWYGIAQRKHQDLYYGYELNENGAIVRYGHDPRDYTTTVLQSKAVDFVDSAHAPFFLYLAPIAPHLPATPAPGDEQAFANEALPRPPSFDEADVSDKPELSAVPRLGTAGAADVAGIRRRMLASLLAVDRAVKAVVDAVAARGQLSNTYFLFSSDNGFLLGEHRLIGKIWPYEESIRVPLVVAGPGVERGVTQPDLALNIDLAPTIAALAGVRPGLPEDGRSLVPLLRGREPPWRSAFIEEFLGDAPAQPRFVGIRTERYLYVEYQDGSRELYDLRDDPYELSNLIGTPKANRLVPRLSAALTKLDDRPAGG